MFRKRPVIVEAVEAITFEELVEYGKLASQHVHGMPWSFEYKGYPITHENDNCYLIPTLEGTKKFNRGDMLITFQSGLHPCKADVFVAAYEPVDKLLAKEWERCIRMGINPLASAGIEPS